MRQKVNRQLVEFQSERDKSREYERRFNDNPDIEQVMHDRCIRDNRQKEDGGEGSRVNKPEIVEEVRQNDVRHDAHKRRHQNSDSH